MVEEVTAAARHLGGDVEDELHQGQMECRKDQEGFPCSTTLASSPV